MGQLDGLAVTVAGAGAFGLATALRLAEAGARVEVRDPAAPADNASGIAAGMLAPAFETLFEPELAHFDLFMAARELWPGLAQRVGARAALDRSGAVLLGDPDELAQADQRLRALGLATHVLSAQALRALHPELSPAIEAGLACDADWRLDPPAMLTALARALEDRGGRIVREAVSPEHRGMLVIATGADAGLADLAPELTRLTPIKGQILHFAAGPREGPTLRTRRGYLAPQPGGAAAGATMEPGRSDREVDEDAVAGLRAEAARLVPSLAQAPAQARAGVRATTADGLPLVGFSRGSDEVLVCVGARRNGWLLAPLVADAVVACLAGDSPPPPFDPARFD